MKNRSLQHVAILLSTIIISLFFVGFKSQPAAAFAAYEQAGSSEILIEKNSLRVLSAKNEHVKRGIASTTKILTAITVIENCPLDKEIEVPATAEGVEGSSIYLKAGEKLTVEELLYGLMLRSGNDAAIALSIAAGGSVENFVSMMNKTARSCGATESNFTNPHGLDDENHYSTAYDLALITAHALKNPVFQKIVDTKNIDISNDNFDYPRTLVNKNKLLFRGEEFDGVKTGYTKKCGRCLVASRTENGMQLIAVVLNLGPMFERCEELLYSGAKNYSLEKILEAGRTYGEADVYAPSKVPVPVTVEKDVFIPLSDEEKKNFSVKVDIEPQYKRKTRVEKISAKIDVFCAKDLIYSFRYAMIIQQ